jgi:hypothetical protein
LASISEGCLEFIKYILLLLETGMFGVDYPKTGMSLTGKCLTRDKWRNSSLKCAHSEICYISPIEESCLFRKQSQNQHLGKRRLAHTVMLRAVAVRFGPITNVNTLKAAMTEHAKKEEKSKKKKKKKKGKEKGERETTQSISYRTEQGNLLVELVSMGMRSKSVSPTRSSDCTFLFIIPGQVSVIAEFPWSY